MMNNSDEMCPKSNHNESISKLPVVNLDLKRGVLNIYINIYIYLYVSGPNLNYGYLNYPNASTFDKWYID